MSKHSKKSTKNDFNKKTKKKVKKAPAPKTGGSWCSTMSRLNKNKDFDPNESW